MNCPYCGHEIDEKDKFCKTCNKPNAYYKEDVVDTNVLNQEYVQYNQKYDKYEESNKLDALRTDMGYVNLNTKWYHHLLIASVGYIAMYIIVYILVFAYSAINAEVLSCAKTNSCSVEVLEKVNLAEATIQLVGELSVIAIVAIIFRKRLKQFFKEFKNSKTWMWFGICIGIMYVANVIYSYILQFLGTTSTSTNQNSVNSVIFGAPLIGFIFVVFAAPLFEEIIFRFGVFRIFTGSKKKEILGVFITMLLFAGIHMVPTFQAVFEDISNPNWELFKSDMLSLPVYLIGAFGLTFAYYKSKNLATSMVTHMVYNLISFVAIIITSAGGVENVIHIFG